MIPLRIFIGYDSREPEAFHVAMHSLMRHSSKPVVVTPLIQSQLRATKLYTRDPGATESTEFALTRFLCPYMSNYEGYALFLDSDILVQADIHELLKFPIADPGKAVYVVPHDYVPKEGPKFLGQPQTAYPRKNWSSVMLFNCGACIALSPDYVNQATGLQLHRFQWTKDEKIGALPLEWNWLVGEYVPNPAAKLLHYTRGGPWFDEFAAGDHSKEWWAEHARMSRPVMV